MKILIEILNGLIAPQLPDVTTAFSGQSVVDFNGKRYFFATYTGVKNLVSDVAVIDYELFAKTEFEQRMDANKTVYRIITVASLYKRLKQVGNKLPTLLALADAQANSGNYDLKSELMRIDKLEYFNLDDPTARPSFLATGEFTNEELDLLFVDAIIDEVPEAHK